MLIPFDKIINACQNIPKGVLHVGAHLAEEAESYNNFGIKNVIWVEADPETFENLKQKITKYNNHKCYCFAAHELDDQELDFHVASNGESSSILEMDKHTKHHPHVKITGKKKVFTKRIDSFINEEKINLNNYNFLNLDIQGAELLALRGMSNSLKKIDYIYTEVNFGEVYKNCAKIDEIDEFLNHFGFERSLTIATPFEWGDALYVKK